MYSKVSQTPCQSPLAPFISSFWLPTRSAPRHLTASLESNTFKE